MRDIIEQDISVEAGKVLHDHSMRDSFFSDDEEFAPAPALLDEEYQDVENALMQTQANEEFDKENPVFLYRMFYNQLFPWKTYFHWLNYDTVPSKSFTHREFSFTLASDIYMRFKSFPNVESLKKEVERLQPIKMDIGAVYSVKPKDKKTVSEKAFKPIEKELVFDIDMTDYDDIRTCCSGGDICLLCWEFMTVAIKIIDTCLREDFGFEHIMWVYSGRRGVHCWVCDERARQLDNESRKAIVNFLDIIKGSSAQNARRVKLPSVLHPSLNRSFKVVDQHFKPLLLQKMGILDTEERWEKLLAIVPDEAVKEKLTTKWKESVKTANERWDLLIKEADNSEKKKKFKDNFTSDIMFQYCYPSLDAKVSTAINHLLKSPFCIHPKTLKVCVPIKPEECELFNPTTVPNLITLRKEIIDFDKETPEEEDTMDTAATDRKMPDYKKTSLKPYIEYFDKFVKNMLSETIKEKRDFAEMSMEF